MLADTLFLQTSTAGCLSSGLILPNQSCKAGSKCDINAIEMKFIIIIIISRHGRFPQITQLIWAKQSD